MRTSTSDIADFYAQISLLLKSGLPLSESIRQLGQNLNKEDFRGVLFDVSDKVSRGETLSGAMRKHPAYFSEVQIRLIEAGEDSEMLPETLEEVAKSARFDLQLSSIVRDMAIYPLFTFWFALAVLLFLNIHLVSDFKSLFSDLAASDIFNGYGRNQGLPLLTLACLDLGEYIVHFKYYLMAGMAGYAVFFLWLFSSDQRAKRILIAMIYYFPGTGVIYYYMDTARLCAMWSVLMRQRIGVAESFRIISSLIDRGGVSSALGNAAKAVENGVPLADALKQENCISGMIALTVSHVPEAALPEELANLANLFREKAFSVSRLVSTIWNIAMGCMLTLSVLTILLILFLPLISFLSSLGMF